MTPKRILFLHPDTYGDLILFEPVLRLVRDAWPEVEIGVVIGERYADIALLLDPHGEIRWIRSGCNPQRDFPGESRQALEALRGEVQAFAPDWLVAACPSQTWLEPAVATFLPDARQISFGTGVDDPSARAALEQLFAVDWDAIYPEKIPVDPDLSDWEKNLALTSALLGTEAAKWWPVIHVPEEARYEARTVLADLGLNAGQYAICAAAGTANVPIKNWPSEGYGEILAWLQKERGISALLVGHESEREILESVADAVSRWGAERPQIWVGKNGQMPLMAGLVELAAIYLGNDTGAMHLAAALGRPVAAVFGGGTWPRFLPVARRSVSIVQPLPCFGCGWDCFFGDAPCVRAISVASVKNALTQFLASDRDEQLIFEASGLEPGARSLIEKATPRLVFDRKDSLERLRQVRELTEQARDLAARLEASDADRDARLRDVQSLEGQLRDLNARLLQSESDRDARLVAVEELTSALHASEADRDARLSQVEELTQQLQTSEADRASRLREVEKIGAMLAGSDADRQARLLQVQQLEELLAESEADRAARLEHMHTLGALLAKSEASREERGEMLDQLHAQIAQKNAEIASHSHYITEISAQLTRPAASVKP